MSSSRGLAVGDYVLEARIGQGAQGEVWRARAKRTGDWVALKLFQLGIDDDEIKQVRRRVDREIGALKSLKDPGIVAVTDYGEQPDTALLNRGYIYVAYELISGLDVDKCLRTAVPPAPAEVLGLLSGLAPGLGKAHTLGLVHRDIKPSNILLRDSNWHKPVLADFGCVKPPRASKLTITGLALGTLGYIAPEVLVDSSSATPRSDQWSLARVAVEGLAIALGAGLEEIQTLGPHEIVEEHIQPHARLTAAALEIPLARDPKRRAADVTAMARSISEAMKSDGLVVSGQAKLPTRARWDGQEPLADYFVRLGFEINDRRDREGCLWVVADKETLNLVRDYLRERGVDLGFADQGGGATQRRPAWYTKSPK